MKKALIILFCTLIVVVWMVVLLWYGLNYYFIPKFVIPQIKQQITIFNRNNKANLKIQDIYYLPLQGFMVKGIELRPILTAEEVDIDLDYAALLSRKVHLSQISIIDAHLNVARSPRGVWNFESTVKGLFGNKRQRLDQPSFIDIDQISFIRGQVYLDDQLFKGDRLTRNFQDVAIRIKSPDKENFFVEVSGADVKRQDAIQFKFDASTKTGLIKGRAQLKIANLADYREYYLGKIILPWHLAKAQLAARAEFSYCQGDFSVDGEYEVKHGQISYGDIKLVGDGSIKHKQKYVKGQPKQSVLAAQVKVANLSLHFEKEPVLEKGAGVLVITDQAVQIKSLQGISQGEQVDLKGKFVFSPIRRLDIAGKIGAENDVLHLKLLSDNAAEVEWLSSSEASSLKVDAKFSDIKELRFAGSVSGQADLKKLPGKILIKGDPRHLTVSVEAGESDLTGNLSFSGKLQGELDRPESLSGKLGLKFEDFSLLGLEPLSFLLGMKVEEGVFSSGIPPMALYQGKLSGSVALDSKHWGIELNLEDVDLAKFTRVNSQLTGLKGLLTGKIAMVGDWKDKKSVWGGGNFSLTNADLKSAPIFSSAQQGVGNVVQNFQLPDFKEVKGDFMLTNEVITFSNTMAKSPDMELRGAGTLDFSLRANFTLGVKFNQKKDFKTAMYVFFPLQTLGFDFLSKAIKVDVKGTFPDLKQTTSVQPLGWLNDTYGEETSFDPDQYTLDNLF